MNTVPLPELDPSVDVLLELSSHEIAAEAMALMGQPGSDAAGLHVVIERLNALAAQTNCPDYIKELALEMQQMLKTDDIAEETN